jgi:hypothetical protein
LEPTKETTTMTIRAVAHGLFRHRLKAVTAAIAPLLVAGWWVSAHPPVAGAEAVLVVPDGAESFAALLASPDLTGLRARVAVGEGGVVRVSLDGADAVADLAKLVEAARRNHGQSALRAESAAADAEAAALAESVASLEAQRAATPATIELSNDSERSRVVEEARSKLFELQTREGELLGKYQPSSPLVQAVIDERHQTEALIRQFDTPMPARSRTGVNPVRQQLEMEDLRLRAALASARSKSRILVERLAGLVHQGSDRVTVAERPHACPPGAGAAMIWAGAAAMGVVLAVLVAVLGDRWSGRFSTPAEVERRLGLPVLTSLPREG